MTAGLPFQNPILNAHIKLFFTTNIQTCFFYGLQFMHPTHYKAVGSTYKLELNLGF